MRIDSIPFFLAIGDLGEDNALYIQVWDQLKAGQ
jgi:hypothetical protein